MIIRPLTLGDLDAVHEWETASFEPGERWSDAAWAAELAADDRTVLAAHVDGALAGVITVQALPPSADLHRLLVDPQHRRRGIGRALIDAGVEAVKQRGAQHVLLEVRYDNEPAITLYGTYGFEQLTVRQGYYGSGKDALIMKLYDLQGDQ